jgi:hypothetical protein
MMKKIQPLSRKKLPGRRPILEYTVFFALYDGIDHTCAGQNDGCDPLYHWTHSPILGCCCAEYLKIGLGTDSHGVGWG